MEPSVLGGLSDSLEHVSCLAADDSGRQEPDRSGEPGCPGRLDLRAGRIPILRPGETVLLDLGEEQTRFHIPQRSGQSCKLEGSSEVPRQAERVPVRRLVAE
jgi:hypothetical protein